MTWTRLSDDYADRTVALSGEAYRLHTNGLVWCNRTLSDGALPRHSIPVVAALSRMAGADLAPVITELIAAGLWVDEGENFQLDWSHQETSDAIRARADANRAHQQAWRDRKAERERKHAAGDHSSCDRCWAVRAGDASKAPHKALRKSTPSPSPSPTQREGEGEGERRKAADAAEPSATAAGSSASAAFKRIKKPRNSP